MTVKRCQDCRWFRGMLFSDGTTGQCMEPNRPAWRAASDDACGAFAGRAGRAAPVVDSETAAIDAIDAVRAWARAQGPDYEAVNYALKCAKTLITTMEEGRRCRKD